MLRRTHVAIHGMESISRKCPYALISTPQNTSASLVSVYLAWQKLNHEWNLKLIQGWGGFSSILWVLIHVMEFYYCPKHVSARFTRALLSFLFLVCIFFFVLILLVTHFALQIFFLLLYNPMLHYSFGNFILVYFIRHNLSEGCLL